LVAADRRWISWRQRWPGGAIGGGSAGSGLPNSRPSVFGGASHGGTGNSPWRQIGSGIPGSGRRGCLEHGTSERRWQSEGQSGSPGGIPPRLVRHSAQRSMAAVGHFGDRFARHRSAPAWFLNPTEYSRAAAVPAATGRQVRQEDKEILVAVYRGGGWRASQSPSTAGEAPPAGQAGMVGMPDASGSGKTPMR